MGAFAIPSLPSVKNILHIDTSPPVVYPPRGRSNSRARTSSSSFAAQSSQQRPSESPQRPIIPTSISSHQIDTSGEWQLLRRPSYIGRPHFQKSQTVQAPAQSLPGPSSPLRTPTRPAHRRTQSALPTPGPPQPHFQQTRRMVPRLHEFCRNPLASSSAMSLPTLAESEPDQPLPTSPVSPISTRSHPISIPPSPSYSLSQVIPLESPFDLTEKSNPLERIKLVHRRTNSLSSSVPPPRPISPTISISSHIFQPRSRRGSTSISDIAVFATWSFPRSLSPEKEVNNTPLFPPGQPCQRLRERLRTLSALDTSSSSPTVSSLASNPNQLRHRHSISLSTPTHHTSSFPTHNLIPPQPLLPPPRPTRRPTTSRLRQPNPLSMPFEPSSSTSNLLGSSPGSMTDDTDSSSFIEVGSDKGDRNESVISLPVLERDGEGRDKGWWKWRRGSISSLVSFTGLGEDDGVVARMKGAGRVENVEMAQDCVFEEGVVGEVEEYIDFADI